MRRIPGFRLGGPTHYPRGSMAARVHLVRHGEVHNPDHLVYASLPGFTLSSTGEAQARAVAIVAEAADKAAEKEETAFRQGYQRGLAEGKKQFLAQIEGQLEKLEMILQEAVSVRQAAMELAEEDLIKLSLLIAEKIVRKEIQLDAEVTKRVLAEAISYLGGATKIFVRVNRQDLPTLAEGEEEIRRLFLEAKTITFVEDESIQPGGCIIETDLGRIDARLETRLDLMKKELLEVMEGD